MGWGEDTKLEAVEVWARVLGPRERRTKSSGSLAEICELPGPGRMLAEKGRGGREGLFGALGDLGTPEGHCAEGRRAKAE